MHLAGIVPLSGCEVTESCEGALFHPSLARLSTHLLAVERSILECNLAGCETIWVVCNEDMQPIIKSRIGDSVSCLESIRSSMFSPLQSEKVKQIPIFYVPVPLSLRGKRDSLGWSILHGANESFMVSAKISKWLQPNKYYVCFPYSVYDPETPSKHKKILTSTHNLVFTSGGQSIQTGSLIGFTFRPEDFKRIRKNIKKECTGSVSKPHWSSRNFKVDKFFKCGNIDNVRKVELDHFYSCRSWDEYLVFLRSEHATFYDKFDLQKLNSIIKERVIT